MVCADEAERLPRVVVKVTCELATGFPPSRTVAVIVDVVFEVAAIVSGFASSVTVPCAMVTVVVFEMPIHVAVMVAVPVVGPGLRVTVATPLLSVVLVVAERFPRVVLKFTGEVRTAFPPSRTVTVIVEVIVEFAAIMVGDAFSASMRGSLIRTASKGIVCP